jgi:hypothetical protein
MGRDASGDLNRFNLYKSFRDPYQMALRADCFDLFGGDNVAGCYNCVSLSREPAVVSGAGIALADTGGRDAAPSGARRGDRFFHSALQSALGMRADCPPTVYSRERPSAQKPDGRRAYWKVPL